MDQLDRAKFNLRLSYDFSVHLLVLVCDAEERGTTYPVPNHSDERAKLPEVRKADRGAILCSRKQVSAPAANTVEKTSRDEHYVSLLASMQNNRGPKPAVKSETRRALR